MKALGKKELRKIYVVFPTFYRRHLKIDLGFEIFAVVKCLVRFGGGDKLVRGTRFCFMLPTSHCRFFVQKNYLIRIADDGRSKRRYEF